VHTLGTIHQTSVLKVSKGKNILDILGSNFEIIIDNVLTLLMIVACKSSDKI